MALFALVGIMIVAFGGLSGYRLLSIIVAVGVFGFTGLCGYMLLERNKYIPVAISVMAASALALLLSLFFNFGFAASSSAEYYLFAVTQTLAIFGAHSALLLLIDSDDPAFRACLFSTIGVIWLLALFLIILEVKPDVALTGGSAFFRALGVFLVLDIAGTVITLLMWRLSLLSKPTGTRMIA